LNELKLNDIIKGEILNISNEGILVQLNNSSKGFIKSIDIDWFDKHIFINDSYKTGDIIQAKVIDVINTKQLKRISLGIKQLSENPWLELSNKHKPGETIVAVVNKVTDFGIFFSLNQNENLLGILPLYNIPKEFDKKIEVNLKLKVFIQNISINQEKVLLSF
jgi:small subunit ribosomal protein S1